jgi:hypothetical protein
MARLNVEDPGQIDGDPDEVAEAALNQVVEVAIELAELVRLTRLQVKNAALSTLLDDPDAHEWSELDLVDRYDASSIESDLLFLQRVVSSIPQVVRRIETGLDEL